MKTYDMSDPYGAEESAIAKRRRLAEVMISQGMNAPVYSKGAAFAKALMMAMSQADLRRSDEETKALSGRREAERQQDMDRMFEFANQRPTVGADFPQKDDDGNDMPGNVQQTADKRMELARLMVRSRTPQVAQFGLQQIMAKPPEEEAFTLKPGERRYKGGKVLAEVPSLPRAEPTFKRGETRRVDRDRDVVTEEWDGGGWKEIAKAPRWAPEKPPVDPLVEVVDPKNPRQTIMVPRSQAAGKSGPGSLTRDRQDREDADGIRKEFNSLPEVKAYKAVVPIIESVKKAKDDPAGDLALVYGVGKVLDPDSVVREGEMTLVLKSGSILERVLGSARVNFGKGRLSPAMRQRLIGMLQQRADEYRGQYDGARKTYEGVAKQRGYDPSQIFTEIGSSRDFKYLGAE